MIVKIVFVLMLVSLFSLAMGQIQMQKDIDELLDMVEKQLMKNEQENNSDAEM